MTDRAAFTAEFVNVKNVPSRKSVQLIFEIPVEQSSGPLEALGGIPHPGQSVMVAVARLETQPAKVEKPKGPTASQRAFRLCQTRAFKVWLQGSDLGAVISDEQAAINLRERLGVTSRGELDTNPEARARFETLEREYQEAIR